MRSSVARRQCSDVTRGLELSGERKVAEALFDHWVGVLDVSPLVPALDLDLHFVLCDFGALGTAYVETVPTEVDRDTIIRNMMSGEYDHPLHVIAVNPAKGWARDVSEDIARALVETAVRGGQSLPPGTQGFVESQLGGVLAEAH